MQNKKLSDADAKKILRESWPTQTNDLWPAPGGSGFWIKGQPRNHMGSGPTLSAPRATSFRTQPDGMWVFFHDWRSCDVVAVEVCGTVQNLNDKRSRYIPSSHGLTLSVDPEWLREEIAVRGRGRKTRWKASGNLKSPGKGRRDHYSVAVRHLRVLYALPNDLYHRWCSQHAPAGYEYFCPHSSLKSINNKKMRDFLKRLSIDAQFYVTPRVKQ